MSEITLFNIPFTVWHFILESAFTIYALYTIVLYTLPAMERNKGVSMVCTLISRWRMNCSRASHITMIIHKCLKLLEILSVHQVGPSKHGSDMDMVSLILKRSGRSSRLCRHMAPFRFQFHFMPKLNSLTFPLSSSTQGKTTVYLKNVWWLPTIKLHWLFTLLITLLIIFWINHHSRAQGDI